MGSKIHIFFQRSIIFFIFRYNNNINRQGRLAIQSLCLTNGGKYIVNINVAEI